MKTLKKILIIADGYPTPKNVSTGVFVKEQLEALKKRDNKISYDIYFNPYYRYFDTLRRNQSPILKVLQWLMQLICFIPYLFKSYDLVHAHRFFVPVFNGVLYKFFRRRPLIVTSHGVRQIEKRYRRRWVKKLFNYCDLIIAVNHEMRSEFIRRFDLPENKVRVRSCGLDDLAFDSFEYDRRIQNKTEKEYLLGFVGGLTAVKRPFMFIKCIEALYPAYPVRGIMIGAGDLSAKIKTYIEEKKLPVLMIDALPYHELIPYFYSFDIFIFPSILEPFGLVGIEALYAHTPVIASNIGGKKDYIKENLNGLFFKPDDQEDLVNKTKYLLDNEVVFNEMKKNARRSVEEYSNRKIAEEILAYYLQVFGDRRN